MIKNFKWLLLASVTITACSSDDDNGTTPEPVVITSGTADFTRYVALGNSLTSGYADNALYKEGQANAWTTILAGQFSLAGGGEFKIPFMDDNYGGLLLGGTQITSNRLYFDGSGPAVLPGMPTTDVLNHLTGPFNNMGVPGAKSFHLLSNSYGNPAGIGSYANPYFVRFASSASATMLGDAVAQNPTFFTLWIGNNDILSYATSGGSGVNQTGNMNPATYGANDITDPTVFAGVYNTLLTGLTANGAKGAVASIPDVATIPFFTTIPYNPVPLDEATATMLNTQLIGPIKQVLTAYGQGDRIGFVAAGASNPLLIKDESLANLSAQLTGALTAAGYPPAQAAAIGSIYGQARHAKGTEGNRDYVLLTTRSLIGTTQAGVPAPFNTVGVTYPLQDAAVLTADEVQTIETAANQYNATIKALSEQFGLAFVDAKAILTQVNNGGIPYENEILKSDFVFGGAFSLDGVHPTPRGYALIANEFSKAINTKYGSNLPMVQLTKYRTLQPASLP